MVDLAELLGHRRNIMKTNVEHTAPLSARMAGNVLPLRLSEPFTLDLDTIFDQFDDLNDDSAEREIARHLDGLVDDLEVLRKGAGRYPVRELLPSLRSLTHISAQLGLHRFARVAHDTITCIQKADKAGTAATLARLQRMGDQLMRDLWFGPVGESV